jgi:flagellar biosynthesis/type III secretory pathway protein FliH
VLGFVEQACERLHGEGCTALETSVRLHPRDVALLHHLLDRRGRGGLLRLKALGLKVVPDESLEYGGCVVETATGHYDADLEGQLRRLHQVLCGETPWHEDPPARKAGTDTTDARESAPHRADGQAA